MDIYLNKNKLNIKINNLDKVDILNKVREKLENAIIDKIYFDDVEITVDFFKKNNIDLTELDKIKFETKRVEDLIQETLIQAKDYLPKLIEALNKTAKLYENNNLQGAADKLDSSLSGLEWYIDAMSSIYNIIGNEKITEKGKKHLKKLDEANSRAMITLQKEDFDYLSVIIEIEIVERLEDLDGLNKELIDN